jgi:hypothetical protein
MPSICVSCIIYTIYDKPVEENKYIQIFLIWLSQFIKISGLGKDDILHMYIDKKTSEYLFTDSIFGFLLRMAKFQTQIMGIPPPKTHLEGMMWKYNLSDYTQDIYMYCDIDILITKSLHRLVSSVKPNTIYVCIEGYMTDPDYGADISPEVIQEGMKGFSAGKFIVSGRDLRDNLFINVKELCNYEKNYYTIEQPFFNRAIMGMTNIDMDLLNSPLISINGESYNKDSTILIDCAGEPGNGEFHYSKILDVFCLLNCDAL